MSLVAGTRLGPYEIQSAIGAGGMGEVYKARDTRLDRTVAIKVLPPDVSGDPERRTRFEREAKTIAGLNHPHICVLHDLGRDGDTDFLVMEYLEGQTLGHRLRKGSLPIAQALEVGTQIADALAKAHRSGIVHRDLKPANVMLAKEGAKLLDFGLAKLRARAARAPTGATELATATVGTTPGTIMGTVPYMAPEQLEGKDCDSRTDLFAFGAVLYEMLTGRRAFPGDSEASVISAIMSSEPPALASLQPLAPPALDRLVRRCLAKDPDSRWQDAADVAEELRGIREDSIARGAVTTPSRSRRSWVLAVAACLVILTAAVVAWVLVREGWPSPVPRQYSLSMPGRTAFACESTTCLAVATDGSGVVYQGREAGVGGLYWQALDGKGSWPLTGMQRAGAPFLSPDGKWLGFFRRSGERGKPGKILKVLIDAGQVVPGAPVREIATAETVRGATWCEDGTIVFGGLEGGLWRVSADGGVPRRLTQVGSTEQTSHRWPSVLPGGRAALFTINAAGGRQDRSAVAVVELQTGTWKTIIEGGTHARYLPSGHLVYARYGTLLAVPFDLQTLKGSGTARPVLSDVWYMEPPNQAAFDVAADGTLVYVHEDQEWPARELVSVGRHGEVQPLIPEPRSYGFGPAISPDGTRLAVDIGGWPSPTDTAIWTYHLEERRWQRLTEGYLPVWSPKGDRIAFTSHREGPGTLYIIRADGQSDAERVTSSPSQTLWPYSWSADGQYVAYVLQNLAPLRLDTWVVPVAPGGKPRMLILGGVVPAFSPDGRWVAYQAGSEAGTGSEVYVSAFPGPGVKVPVTNGGGLAPVWSGDGQELFYVTRLHDSRIMSRRVVSQSPLRFGPPQVAFALPFELEGEIPYHSRSYGMTPDARRVFAVQPDDRARQEINTLEVIANWPAEVKSKLTEK